VDGSQARLVTAELLINWVIERRLINANAIAVEWETLPMINQEEEEEEKEKEADEEEWEVYEEAEKEEEEEDE
jgi:hypothetical protein